MILAIRKERAGVVHDVQRIEAFTDAVFAFAVTLLAVSLEVPKSFDQLLETMKGFAGFAFTSSFLFLNWYRHYIFFRKYGIDDRNIIILNGVFLFAVLFFIYPFKFLSYIIVTMIFDFNDQSLHALIDFKKMPELISLYYFGIAMLNGSLGLMYHRALKYRLHLELDRNEEMEALKNYMTGVASMPAFLVAIGLAFILPYSMIGFSILPVLFITILTRRLKKSPGLAMKFMPRSVARPE